MTQMSIEKYLKWVKDNHGHDYESTVSKNRYNTNVKTVQGTIADSAIVHEIEDKLGEWAIDYEKETGSSLFMLHKPSLQFSTKAYESTIDKIFRINCLRNKKFPDAPPKSDLD